MDILQKVKQGQSLSADEIELLDNALTEKNNSNHKSLIEAVALASVELSTSENFTESLNIVFRLLGEATGVDRVYYFENHPDPNTGETLSSQKIEWARDRIEPCIDKPELQNIFFQDYGEFYYPLMAGDTLNLIVRKVSSPALKSLLEMQDIKSILALPIWVDNKFHGFVGFDHCRKEKVWTGEEKCGLQILASHLSQLIEKEEVRKLLAKTYRQAKIGTWSIDLETDHFFWSEITKEIFELPKSSVPNREMAYKVFKDKNDINVVDKAIKHSIATGEPYELDLEIISFKGNRKWIRDTGQIEYKNGKPASIHGTVQDIDEQKRAEIESEKNKKLLDAITDQAQVGILVREIDGKHLFANDQWKKIHGLEGKEVVGKYLTDLFEKKYAHEISKTDREIFNAGKQSFYEDKVETEKGPRYFMVNKFPLKGIAGIDSAIVGIGTDITEIKETEAKLQKAEQKLRDLVEHSTNLFYSHYTNHELFYISPQSTTFFGIDPTETHHKWTDFITDNPINKKGLELTEKAIRTGLPQPAYELEFQKMGGSTIWVEVNEAPIVKNGETVLITGSLTDITDRKRAEAEIQNSLKEKTTLLAEIHHRVKNNLAVVASMMQMQAHITGDDKLTESLMESVLRIKSMANIHEQLYKSQNFAELDFSENLKELINSVISTMQFSVDIELHYECVPVQLSVNEAIPCSLIVNEVVTNIVKHAFKGMERGNVYVELREHEGKTLYLKIKDNGNGLPENFDIENSTTLGLQLIRTLSEQLEGNYNYQSDDTGCTFSLSFDKTVL